MKKYILTKAQIESLNLNVKDISVYKSGLFKYHLPEIVYLTFKDTPEFKKIDWSKIETVI